MNYNQIAQDINTDINNFNQESSEALKVKSKIYSNMSEAGAYGNRFNYNNKNFSVQKRKDFILNQQEENV